MVSSVDSNMLKELAGEWKGTGLNIVAVPNGDSQGNLLFGVNQMSDTLSFTPASARIMNRGFSQSDTEFDCLTYVHRTTDSISGRSIHLEPGIWINQPSTTQPLADPPPGGQLVARMWSITHGSSFVAQGFAKPFSGPPVIGSDTDFTCGSWPAFSSFPAFNTTPIVPAFPNAASKLFTAGASGAQSGTEGGFPEYFLSNHAEALPSNVTQRVLNDPVIQLQETVQEQISEGYQFEGVALNISTSPSVPFHSSVSTHGDTSSIIVKEPQFDGAIASHSFLRGTEDHKPNAITSLLYATYWIENISHPDGRPPFMQLQYVQNALVNFPARTLPGEPNVSWPHVTVSTLRKMSEE